MKKRMKTPKEGTKMRETCAEEGGGISSETSEIII